MRLYLYKQEKYTDLLQNNMNYDFLTALKEHSSMASQ